MPLEDLIKTHLNQTFPRYLEILQQMVEINSFTANPRGVNQLGELTSSLFSHLDFQAEFIPAANPLYGEHLFLYRAAKEQPAGKPAPTIAMISHLDTVFSPEEEIKNNFNFRIENNRVYGPGTVDIKGGSLIMLMIMDALNLYAPRAFENTEWILAFNACEEVLADDFGKLLLDRLPSSPCACLVFEGGTPVQETGDHHKSQTKNLTLVTARKGRATFHIEIEGKSAHSGNNHASGANAIVQLAHIIQALACLTAYDKQLTVNVGTVRGGSVTNRVPHFAEATAELRAFSPRLFQETIKKIISLEKSIQVRSQDGFSCRVTIETIDRTAPWPDNIHTARLLKTWSSTASRLGIQISSEARGGLSDGNFLWEKFPTLDGLGPVGANAHCSERSKDGTKDQEYALLDSFVPKALLNALAILHLLDQAKYTQDI